MKCVFWSVGLLFLSLLVACGPTGPTVDKPAVEMNLTTEDIGELSLETESGLQDLLTMLDLQDPNTVKDAHQRSFASDTEPATQVVATILVFDSAGNAQNGLAELSQGHAEALKKDTPDVALSELTTEMGDQTHFVRADIPDQEHVAYHLLVRDNNVLGMIVVRGPTDSLEESWVRELGQKMLAHVPEPATNP